MAKPRKARLVCSACGAKEGTKGWDSVSCTMYAREVKDDKRPATVVKSRNRGDKS